MVQQNTPAPAPQKPKENILQLLAATPRTQIAALPDIAERFKNLFKVIHPGQNADLFYEAEKFHFMKLVSESADLKACTKLSLYGSFLDSAVNGLSFDPSFKHQYIYARNHKVLKRGEPDNWEKRATVNIGGPGELVLRQNGGQIKYADNPVLAYEGDDLEFGNKNGKSFVDHTIRLAKRTDKILIAYIKLTRPDDSYDYKWITEQDMARFMAFAKDSKTSKAYGIGIGGMWLAKVMKHAFRGWPKVRVGKFSELGSDTVDELSEVVSSQVKAPQNLDYGIDESNYLEEGSQPENYGNAHAMAGASDAPAAGDANAGTFTDHENLDENFAEPEINSMKPAVTRNDDDF